MKTCQVYVGDGNWCPYPVIDDGYRFCRAHCVKASLTVLPDSTLTAVPKWLGAPTRVLKVVPVDGAGHQYWIDLALTNPGRSGPRVRLTCGAVSGAKWVVFA